eukprot:SAG11_NODE_21822_length_418_cov_0.630094_2_plen_87_part_01
MLPVRHPVTNRLGGWRAALAMLPRVYITVIMASSSTVMSDQLDQQPVCSVTEGYDFTGNDLLGPDGKPAPQHCPDGPGACCSMCARK